MITKKSYRYFIVAGVFLFVIFLTFFRFADSPSVWVDEGTFTETAKNMAWHGKYALQTAPGEFESASLWTTSGYPLILPVAANLYLFRAGIFQARFVMGIYIVLLVLLFYLFARKKYGFFPALIAALLLASFGPLYGNGRPVQGEVPGLVFLMLGALMFLCLEKNNFKNLWFSFFAGLGFGLAASTKPLYLMVLLPALALALIIFRKRVVNPVRNSRGALNPAGMNPRLSSDRSKPWSIISNGASFKKVLICLFIGFALPIIAWTLIQFPTKEVFFRLVSVYFSGDPSSSKTIFEAVSANFLRFFTEATPILFLILFIIVIAAFAVRIARVRRFDSQHSPLKYQDISIAEFIVLFFIILNWLAYLRGPGWYRHFFPAHALLYLLFPAAVITLKDYMAQWLMFLSKAGQKKKTILLKVFLLVPLFLILFQFYHLTFFAWSALAVKRTTNSRLQSELGKIPPEKHVFFYEAIEAAIFLKHDNYSQTQYAAPTDVLGLGLDRLNELNHNVPDVVVAKLRAMRNNGFTVSQCYSRENIIGDYALFYKQC